MIPALIGLALFAAMTLVIRKLNSRPDRHEPEDHEPWPTRKRRRKRNPNRKRRAFDSKKFHDDVNAEVERRHRTSVSTHPIDGGQVPTDVTHTDETAEPDTPYELQSSVLTKAEMHFYRTLLQATDLVICPKIRMADFLYVQRNTNRWQSAQNRINMKHVDFLLCCRSSMKPMLAIELDDSSHNKPHVKARDAFVEKAYETAEIPLLRQQVRRDYSTAELKASIDTMLKT